MSKKMKRISVFALALLMLALCAVTALAASAYTPLNSNSTTSVAHTMTITEAPYNLAGTITYKFAVDTTTGVTVAAPNGVSAADVVTGNPSFESPGTVSYGPSDDFSGGTHSVTKNVAVNWNGVTFKEPGKYYWKVDKTIDPAVTAPLDANKTTNDDSTTYLWAYVTDENGVLTLSATGLSTTTALSEKVDIQDQYPSEQVKLSVSKTVTGTQGSKDEYFKFDITLTLPANVATNTYAITGFDSATDVNASPYNSNAVQPTSPVSLSAGQNTAITVWLKHGQTVEIAGLPYGTGYSIVETNGDYTVTTANTGDQKNGTGSGDDIATGTSATVADSSMEADTTVAYTNNKGGTTPTGIIMQVGAPIAGILLVCGLFAVLIVSKRKKQREAE